MLLENSRYFRPVKDTTPPIHRFLPTPRAVPSVYNSNGMGVQYGCAGSDAIHGFGIALQSKLSNESPSLSEPLQIITALHQRLAHLPFNATISSAVGGPLSPSLLITDRTLVRLSRKAIITLVTNMPIDMDWEETVDAPDGESGESTDFENSDANTTTVQYEQVRCSLPDESIRSLNHFAQRAASPLDALGWRKGSNAWSRNDLAIIYELTVDVTAEPPNSIPLLTAQESDQVLVRLRYIH